MCRLVVISPTDLEPVRFSREQVSNLCAWISNQIQENYEPIEPEGHGGRCHISLEEMRAFVEESGSKLSYGLRLVAFAAFQRVGWRIMYGDGWFTFCST